jgi:hypothetical protein
MVIEVLSYSTKEALIPATRITAIDRANKYVVLENRNIASNTVSADDIVVVQGSYNKELTGLGAIFGTQETLYGLSRVDYKWLTPAKSTVSNITDVAIQAAIDDGSMSNFIAEANELATGEKHEGLLDAEGNVPAAE